MSYTDILRKAKADLELTDLSGSVNGIWRMHKGNLMLELNKSSGKAVDIFRGQIENVLGEQADVKARKQQIVVIECKDLDEVTRGYLCCAKKNNSIHFSRMEERRENIDRYH